MVWLGVLLLKLLEPNSTMMMKIKPIRATENKTRTLFRSRGGGWWWSGGADPLSKYGKCGQKDVYVMVTSSVGPPPPPPPARWICACYCIIIILIMQKGRLMYILKLNTQRRMLCQSLDPKFLTLCLGLFSAFILRVRKAKLLARLSMCAGS